MKFSSRKWALHVFDVILLFLSSHVIKCDNKISANTFELTASVPSLEILPDKLSNKG